MKLTEKEMDAVEDQFFCETSEAEYAERRPTLVRVWKKLCSEQDKEAQKKRCAQ